MPDRKSSQPEKPERPSKNGSKAPRKSPAPRPDEMSAETFEFLAAIDEYKRERMLAHLESSDVIEILAGLGYERPKRKADPVREYDAALAKYRKDAGRLFPNWSEVFEVVRGLGYQRAAA